MSGASCPRRNKRRPPKKKYPTLLSKRKMKRERKAAAAAVEPRPRCDNRSSTYEDPVRAAERDAVDTEKLHADLDGVCSIPRDTNPHMPPPQVLDAGARASAAADEAAKPWWKRQLRKIGMC